MLSTKPYEVTTITIPTLYKKKLNHREVQIFLWRSLTSVSML